MKIIKPALLKKGDTIGILAPSGAMEDDTNLIRAVSFLKNKGYKVKLSDNIYIKNKYLAGTDEERLSAIHYMFADKSVNAIICLRGGYGAIRLINKINYELIRENPKIFCGYSDITALNAMFLKRSGLMTYSGPMILSDFGQENICEYTINKFFDTVCENKFDYEGTFWGGNLSTLVSLCGQDFIPDYEFTLFLEDLNEPLYKIDKMVTQLFNIEKIRKNSRAIAIGDFLNCESVEYIFEELNLPLIKNFPASHSAKKATIPYGFNTLI